ncbi:DUF5689 domain-containing protein [Sphingobacterium sp.]|uniref:DUF5689 domain-containing protein n=1 Tax=Sphingobacterium sp. TaxID=341027 RepID=UPI002586574F|nr:DUF5689 domain-containing protein [Sphingobacterium sp.]WET67042.1 MAG: DUF5689 domain-containing protein [Sphingobacterium sp.]
MKVKIKSLVAATILILGLSACKKNTSLPDTISTVEVKAISIADLKGLSNAVSFKVPDGRKISGVVISDREAKNIDNKTVVLQEAPDKSGIVINFEGTQSFSVGDQLEINISNQNLAQINGEVVLDKIPVINAKKTGTTSIKPKGFTVAEVISNAKALDGTLVKISVTGLSGGNGNYSGMLTIRDASGQISSKILPGAVFENKVYPVLVNGITGIVRIDGNITRIDIRNSEDLSTSITRLVVDEDFTKMTYGMDVSWKNFTAISPLSADNNLDASKKYFYGGLEYQGSGGFIISGTGLQGLKEMSLDISYSKFTGNVQTINKDFTGGMVYSFNPAKDINQLSVELDFGDFTVPFLFYKIKDVGNLHTIALQIPKTEADFKKEFLLSGMSEADYIAGGFPDYLKTTVPHLARIIVQNGVPAFSANYPATPQELEGNKFINTRDNEPQKTTTAAGVTVSTRPFAIGKITYGYEK